MLPVTIGFEEDLHFAFKNNNTQIRKFQPLISIFCSKQYETGTIFFFNLNLYSITHFLEKFITHLGLPIMCKNLLSKASTRILPANSLSSSLMFLTVTPFWKVLGGPNPPLWGCVVVADSMFRTLFKWPVIWNKNWLEAYRKIS